MRLRKVRCRDCAFYGRPFGTTYYEITLAERDRWHGGGGECFRQVFSIGALVWADWTARGSPRDGAGGFEDFERAIPEIINARRRCGRFATYEPGLAPYESLQRLDAAGERSRSRRLGWATLLIGAALSLTTLIVGMASRD